jgi:hypothetical protein
MIALFVGCHRVFRQVGVKSVPMHVAVTVWRKMFSKSALLQRVSDSQSQNG